MKKQDSKINCPIFQRQEPVIEDITAKINDAGEVLEKAEFAHKLQEEVDVLLSCLDYDEKNADCSNCRFIANLRKKTTDLVIKAKKLL
jgi:ABC-type hemin transport system substrate-binding protein